MILLKTFQIYLHILDFFIKTEILEKFIDAYHALFCIVKLFIAFKKQRYRLIWQQDGTQVPSKVLRALRINVEFFLLGKFVKGINLQLQLLLNYL